MCRYVIERLFANLLAFWIIVTATFFLMKALPGDPFTQERALPKEILHSLYEHYHLNDPLLVQYGHYLGSILRGDLGPSFIYKNRTVNEIIWQGFPTSCLLGLEALLFATLFGLFFGTIAALWPQRWQDHLAMLLALIGLSVPSFILATFLQYLFAIRLDWFPVARWGSVQHSILPALALAALPMAFIARLTRASLLDVLSKDYIKLAIAKGLPPSRVIVHHGLRNALLPVVTYLGMLAASILTGSFVVEKLFGIPGLGQTFVTAIAQRDYSLIMGLTVFYSFILLSSVFLTDLVYCTLDPRIKLKEAPQ